MNSRTLWTSRLRSHHKQLNRLLKYVLNDHFLLLAVFLVGALLFQYSLYVKQLSEMPLVDWCLLLLVLATLPMIGQVATLVQKADLQFWSVSEEEWYDYFKRALLYSSVLPLALNSLVVFLLYPLFEKVFFYTNLDMLLFLLVLLGLKAMDWLLRYLSVKVKHPLTRYQGWLRFGVNLIVLSVVQRPVFSLGCLLVLFVGIGFYIQRLIIYSMPTVDWYAVVSFEQERQKQLYHYVSFVVDVPKTETVIIRKIPFLERLVNWLVVDKELPLAYLYARVIVRNRSYLSYIGYMLILAITPTFFVRNLYWLIAIHAGLLLLTGLHLMSVVKAYHQSLYVTMYSITPEEKLKSIQQVLFRSLQVLGGIFYSVIIGFSFVVGMPIQALFAFFIYEGVIGAYCFIYLKQKIN